MKKSKSYIETRKNISRFSQIKIIQCIKNNQRLTHFLKTSRKIYQV